jgi:hypothetical protein
MRRSIAILSLALAPLFASVAQIGGQTGAYSRMGFGARGMGMGNAMSAVTTGDILSYYNPALVPFSATRHATASFGILSLDRRLNFLDYTQQVPPLAGVSIGFINSGVTGIDGRDSDGEQTGPLHTEENQILLGFAVKVKEWLSVGLNFKLHLFQLYTDVSSTTVGMDLGVVYIPTSDLTIGFAVRDLTSKYKWDTAPLYGTSGSTSVDNFPKLFVLGAAYQLPDSIGLISAEVELSNPGTTTLRAGAEVPVIRELTLRAGIDRVDLKNKGMGVRPAFGFTLRKDFDGWTPAVNYAYILEPFSPSGMHMISLAVTF